MSRRTCLLILGMHRSGTSALAGLLHHLGVSMGKDLLAPAWDNPKGFYENKRIMIFNDSKLLPALKTTWYDLAPIKGDHFPLSEELKHEALKILEEDYGETNLFGIKDPRMCITLPFWEEVLSEFESEIKVIIPYRNPLEVAYSLFHRNNFPIGKGLFLWAKYILYSEYYSRKFQRVFISYDQLVRDPLKTLELVDETLKLGLSEEIRKNSQEITSFVERSLKKFNLSLKDLPPNTPKFVSETALLLEKLAIGEERDSQRTQEKFNQFRESYEREAENYHLELINHEGARLQVLLFIDDGKGFREELSLSHKLQPVKTSQEITFELPPGVEVHTLRFDLPNMPCICQLERALLIDGDRELTLSYTAPNPIISSGDQVSFLKAPQILIKPQKTPGHGKFFKITFKLVSIREKALEEISERLQRDREELLREISEIYLSKFWKLMRPVRLILRGDFRGLLRLIQARISKEYWVIRRSGLFDEAWYLKQYPDVRKADIDPLEHYVLNGWEEGRDPAPWFNTNFYLQNNPDIAKKGINPFFHWIKWGRHEGRKPNPN